MPVVWLHAAHPKLPSSSVAQTAVTSTPFREAAELQQWQWSNKRAKWCSLELEWANLWRDGAESFTNMMSPCSLLSPDTFAPSVLGFSLFCCSLHLTLHITLVCTPPPFIVPGLSSFPYPCFFLLQFMSLVLTSIQDQSLSLYIFIRCRPWSSLCASRACHHCLIVTRAGRARRARFRSTLPWDHQWVLWCLLRDVGAARGAGQLIACMLAGTLYIYVCTLSICISFTPWLLLCLSCSLAVQVDIFFMSTKGHSMPSSGSVLYFVFPTTAYNKNCRHVLGEVLAHPCMLAAGLFSSIHG